MSFITIEQQPTLRSPVLIMAFEGWNDAAEVATGAVKFLVRSWSAQTFATVDPEEFYVFSETRPHVRHVGPHERRVDWPSNTFYYHRDPVGERDLVLLLGVEPQLRWRAFSRGILDVARRCEVSMVVNLGGLLAEVVHSRPPRISGSGTTPRLVERVRSLGIEGSRYEGPTGIVGVLQDVCRQEKIPAASLWGQVPHYLSTTTNPQVKLALLSRLAALLDLRLNLDEQDLEARRFAVQVDAALTRDPDAAAYVRRLESQIETEEPEEDAEPPVHGEGSLPNGEVVVRELEDFLRRRRSQEDDEE